MFRRKLIFFFFLGVHFAVLKQTLDKTRCNPSYATWRILLGSKILFWLAMIVQLSSFHLHDMRKALASLL